MSAGQSSIGRIRPIYARRRLKAIAARWDPRAGAWERALADPACPLNEDGAYGRFTGSSNASSRGGGDSVPATAS